MDDPGAEEIWRPREFRRRASAGPTRLREALVRSRNLVSIRLLREMGVRPVIDYVSNFGFTAEQNRLPNNLTLALGSMQATPLEMATGFAVFANGGYQGRALLHRSHRRAGRDRSSTRRSHARCARVRAARISRCPMRERAKERK